MRHILDPKFKYTPAAQTDIRKTFERVRAEQAAAKWLSEMEIKQLAKEMRGEK